MKKELPLVVIFGRTNVGKSTLFNCLLERKKALVSNIPGTTRDSNLGTVEWSGVSFELADTGGIMDFTDKYLFSTKKTRRAKNKTDEINIKVQKQAIAFLKKADIILFVVDNKTGLLPQDKELTDLLKKNLIDDEKIMLIANKVDGFRQRPSTAEFNRLNFNEPIIISATTGSGTGDLLDIIIKDLKKKKLARKTPKSKTKEEKREDISICILGKPNVGKSSLLNKLIGYEKVIVSDLPHTTREPQDTELTYNNRELTFIDTAGVSKRGTKTKGLERFGIEKSLRTLSRSDIVLLVIDIKKGITHQDAKLIEEITERGKSFIIIANKWDLMEERNTKLHTKYIHSMLPFATWAPIQFVSALTGEKVKKIFDLVLEIDASRKIEIPDSALDRLLSKLVKIHPPSKGKGYKRPRVYELKQIAVNPPKFTIKIGSGEDLHNSYSRFIKNKIREKYKIIGTPLSVRVVKNKKIHGQAETLIPKQVKGKSKK